MVMIHTSCSVNLPLYGNDSYVTLSFLFISEGYNIFFRANHTTLLIHSGASNVLLYYFVCSDLFCYQLIMLHIINNYSQETTTMDKISMLNSSAWSSFELLYDK